MSDKETPLKKLIERGKIRTITLPAKIEELKHDQLLLLKDDVKNIEILLSEKRFRGAFIHAFDAMERAIDIFLLGKGLKITDRHSRKVAVKELLGPEFLGEYEELFELRKRGMYDRYDLISESDVAKIMDDVIPRLLRKAKMKNITENK